MIDSTKAYIFDFNGVLLWDTHFHDQAWKDYSAKLRGTALSDDEMLHKVHGRTNKDVLEYLVGSTLSADLVKQYADEKETTYRQICLNNPTEFVLAPGAVEFLDYLKASPILMTIATSSELGNVNFFFEHLNLANWFDFNLVAYDEGTINGKPAPDLYLKAAKSLDVDVADCTVIEDSRSGIVSAHTAGIGHIIALGPKPTQAELAQLEGVNQVITDFNDLLAETEA